MGILEYIDKQQQGVAWMAGMMDRTAWEKAKKYMLEQARPVERAMFAFEFLGGAASAAVDALAGYQNEDGGFGRALEPDVRMNGSSVIATTVALQHLSLLPRQESETLAKRALEFLQASYLPERRGWENVPPAVNEAPHAPWWNYAGGNPNWGNPNAEIAGYFMQFSELVPSPEWTNELVGTAVDYLLTESSLDEFHELLCYLRLAERVPLGVQARMSEPLGQMVERCVVRDPGQWGGYGLQPVGVASSPLSPYYERLAPLLPANLEWLLERQTEEGVWEPVWSWGQYEEVWPQAREEWTGVLTLEKLRILRAYGRINEE